MHLAITLLALSLTQAEPPRTADAAEVPPSAATPAVASVAAVATPPPSAAAPVDPAPAPPRTAGPAPTAASKATFWGFVDAQLSRTAEHSGAPGTSTAELRRARIGARGQVADRVGYAVLFDAADASLKDAYLGLQALPGLELRIGQWKTAFGYEQSESDTKLLWVNSSYVVAALARGVDSRDLGVGAIGRWPLAGSVAAEVAASVVNGAGPNHRDDLDAKNVWGRGGVAVALRGTTLRAGGSFGYGEQIQALGANGKFDGAGPPTDDTYFYFRTAGIDATLDGRWLFAAAELIQSDRDVSRYAAPGAPARSRVTARGWYAGVYGKTPWKVGPILRVERFDPSRSAAGDLLERYTFGAYADVVPVNARLVFNYEVDASQRGAAGRAGDRAILFAQVIF